MAFGTTCDVCAQAAKIKHPLWPAYTFPERLSRIQLWALDLVSSSEGQLVRGFFTVWRSVNVDVNLKHMQLDPIWWLVSVVCTGRPSKGRRKPLFSGTRVKRYGLAPCIC